MLHQGVTYLVEEFNLNSLIAKVRREDVNYYTKSRKTVDVAIKKTYEKKTDGFNIGLGEVIVTEHYHDYVIKTYDEVFEAVRDAHKTGHDVLFEGLLLSTETQRVIELALELPTLIIGLDVDVDVCLDSINFRRRTKDPNAEPVNPKGTESKHRTNQRAMAKFQGLELQAEWHDRDGAFKRICEELGL